MKKVFLTILAAFAVTNVFAGGIMTNTNQSAQWVRHLARGTSLDPDAVYFNPAGTAFMEDGFHFSLGNQFVFQNRRSEITYAPFAMNGGNDTKRFDGKTFAPLLPNLDLVWKYKRFAIMASVGVGGGGGKAKYNDGLGAFESQFAVLPLAISQLGIPTNQYSLDCKVHGYQVTYAVNIGASVRLTKWLSFAAQARINYITNEYKGNIGNIMINPTLPALGLDGTMKSAYGIFSQVASLPDGAIDPTLKAAAGQYAGLVADKQLNAEQTGWGISPVLALYFNHKGWSASVKYEFRTAITLKNKTKVDDTGLYPDGAKTPYDQPALLAVALSKRFVDKVTLTAQYHCYFDKDAHFENAFGTDIPKQNLVNRNTMEYIVGVEWNINKRWLVSCGLQYTDYNVKDAFHSELGYQLDCLTFGLGGAFNISEKVRFNLSACHGFYLPHTVNAVKTLNATTVLPYDSKYSRRSTIVSVGFDFKFAKRNR
ncbi:MAG: OmpP1/FadL family transporter [Alistipes sp.]